MKTTWMFGLAALSASLSAGQKAIVDGGPIPAPDVTVYVDSAGVLWMQTRVLADRMLAAAGVRVTWRIGEPNANAADGLVISVRFVHASRDLNRAGTLACAYVFGGGVRKIKVSYPRVRATAVAAGVEDYRLTAHVLVHEISHVLQRIDRHSDSGLMKARWTLADYGVMARKTLPFTAEDIEFMRRGMAGVGDRVAATGME